MKTTDLDLGDGADIDPASPRPAASGNFLPVGIPVAAVIMRLRNRTLVRVLSEAGRKTDLGER
ncbi:hypothetical protein [Agrobacterium rosae]